MKTFADLTTKKDRTRYIREALGHSHKWALQALLRIYANQTEDEQVTESTREHNGIGFTGPDAEILTSYAKQYEVRGSLSPKQMKYLHKLMPKYAVQLERVSRPSEAKR